MSIFERIPWSNEAAKALSDSLACDVSIIADQVNRAIARCWRINGGESYMVTRNEGDTLVLVAFEGEHLRELAPFIIDAAQRAGCKQIRFHTQRPGLIRLLREYNPEPLEYVCIVNIGSKH